MIGVLRAAVIACTAIAAQLPPLPAASVDPELRAAVEQFFAAQESENASAYLALWSRDGRRPRPEMLQYVFDAGDDRYSNLVITRVAVVGERTRVRVSVTRERTTRTRPPGAQPVTVKTATQVSLTYVREDDAWKLFSEGTGWDDLAEALIEARTPEERAALMHAEPDLVEARLLLAIARRASEAAQMQRFGDAQVRYRVMIEVARALGETDHEAEALQNLGNAYYYQQNFPAALAAYEQRLALERGRGQREGVAAALSGIATIRYSAAEYDAAMGAYREALAIHEQLNDEAGLATTLISTGNIFYVQGDYEAAIADYERSRALHRKLLNTSGEARALEGLGRAAMARGDYARALEAFAGVLEEGRARSDRIVQGTALLNFGDIHFRLGNLDVARTSFEESRGHFEAAKDTANAGRAWQALGITELLAGRFAVAESAYQKSIVSCSSAGDGECTGAAWSGLGFAQMAQEKHPESIASYRKAIEIFVGLKQAENAARAQIGLAQAFSGTGEHKAAIDTATEARRTAIGRGLDDVLWRALIAEARALRSMKDAPAALATARAAASAVERIVAHARVRPDQPVARDTSAIFRTLAVLHAEAGDARAAFELVERMRVHELRVALAGVEREIARGMTVAEREEERTLARELVGLHAPLTRQTRLPRPDTAAIAALETRVADAASRADAHRRRIFERVPELPIWRGVFDAATAAELDGFLATPEVAFLQLVMDEDEVLALTARRREAGVDLRAWVVPVKRKALAETVARLTLVETLRDRSRWRSAAADLLKLLPRDVMDSVDGVSELLVIPHELLWRIPYEALPVGAGHLGDTVQVRYAHSISALLRTPPRDLEAPPVTVETPDTTRRVLVAAAPDLHETVRARLERTAPGWRLPPAMPAAPPPALADIQEEQVTLLTGAQPTESALREHLSRAAVAHIALPFRVNVASPLFSPLLTAGELRADAPDSSEDGALELREIINLEVPAAIVVLTDGAALSMREAADDAALVHWAWQAAGVRTVMMPRWSGDAAVADRLLAAFHETRRKGRDAAASLHAAQSAIRRTDETASPYDWAGWILFSGR